jgi:hypothetical protein
MSFALDQSFNLTSIATLILNATEAQILRVCGRLFESIGEAFSTKLLDAPKCLAFFTILFGISEPVRIECVRFFTGSSSKSVTPLKLDLYRRVLKRSDFESMEQFINPISRFAWANFKQGGMILIAQILVQNALIGVGLFEFDNLELLNAFCLRDGPNCVVYLEFARFGFSVCNSMNRLSDEMVIGFGKLAFSVMHFWSENLQQGEDIVSNCIYAIQDIAAVKGVSLRQAFHDLGGDEQQAMVQIVQKHIAKAETKQKIRALKTFSTTRRGRESTDDGEWQTLDGLDD